MKVSCHEESEEKSRQKGRLEENRVVVYELFASLGMCLCVPGVRKGILFLVLRPGADIRHHYFKTSPRILELFTSTHFLRSPLSLLPTLSRLKGDEGIASPLYRGGTFVGSSSPRNQKN